MIPIEEEILKILETYGFEKDYAWKCIDANIHNHVTSTYYIILKWFWKLGKLPPEETKDENDSVNLKFKVSLGTK